MKLRGPGFRRQCPCIQESVRAATALRQIHLSHLVLLILHGLLQSPDAVQLEPVEGLRHLSPSKVYE